MGAVGDQGVDYSTGRPNLAALRASGRLFVCRYLAYLPNGKVLSRSERAAIHAAGLEIVLNWEQSDRDMLKGRNTGITHATEALRQAKALGAPANIPIYFSCDTDTNAAQRVQVAAYLDGAASILGRNRVGVYGGFSVIEAMVPNHAAWGWQTYAWSAGKTSSKAHFKQYRNGVPVAGADCDLNVKLQANIGAWLPNGSAEGDDMDLTPANLTAIADAVWQHHLEQGTDGYAGQQAETAAAFAWKSANAAAEKAAEAAADAAGARSDLATVLAALTRVEAALAAGGTPPITVTGGIDGTYEVHRVNP